MSFIARRLAEHKETHLVRPGRTCLLLYCGTGARGRTAATRSVNFLVRNKADSAVTIALRQANAPLALTDGSVAAAWWGWADAAQIDSSPATVVTPEGSDGLTESLATAVTDNAVTIVRGGLMAFRVDLVGNNLLAVNGTDDTLPGLLQFEIAADQDVTVMPSPQTDRRGEETYLDGEEWLGAPTDINEIVAG